MLTGNPVRADITSCTLTPARAKETLGMDPAKKMVLVVGGSLGARTVNEAIAASLPMLRDKGVNLLWQTGRYGAPEFQAMAKDYDNVTATTFISEMEEAYRAADIVVARAGAGTISELQNIGRTSILIPSPNVAEDHQRHNAEALSNRGAAIMILDADAVAKLPTTLSALIDDPDRCRKLSNEIQEMALRNADEKIVDKIAELITTK